jgi:hypothetical protein
MSGRLFRNVAGLMLPADDQASERQLAVPSVGLERRRPIREAECGPERDDEPPFVSIPGPGGTRIPVRGHLDICTRDPAMEAWSEGFTGLRGVKVWTVHCQNLPGLSAVTQEGHVFVNTAARTWRCPVLKLAVLRHELEHLVRGDRGGQVDADAEGECETAAEAAIVGILVGVDRKRPAMTGAATDPATCQACYRSGATTCRQGEANQARILDALPLFTR